MSAANLDPRTVRRVRLALVLAAATAFGLAYWLSPGFSAEVERTAGILYRGDVAGLKSYILSFGAWAPVVSALLMIFQALAAPLPAFVLAFANGLASHRPPEVRQLAEAIEASQRAEIQAMLKGMGASPAKGDPSMKMNKG